MTVSVPISRAAAVLLLALAVAESGLSGREGLVDSTFDPGAGPSRPVTALAMQGTKILVGGDFTTVAGTERFRLARLNPDGSVDPTFTAIFGEAVGPVAVQADGRVLVGGTFSVVNGQQRRGLVRLLPDGALDSSFVVGSGVDGSVSAITIQPDGRILIGGFFTSVNGTARRCLARLRSDGSIDDTFNADAAGTVTTIGLRGDGAVVIGGHFSTVNGTSRPYLARLTNTGTLDTTFAPDTGTSLSALALQPDGAVVARRWSFVGGVATSNLTRFLGTTGQIDPSFQTATIAGGSQPDVYTLTAQPDGRILAGGNFETVNGTPSKGLVRLNGDGTVDDTFTVGAGVTGGQSVVGGVYAITLQQDGRILIGGDFTAVDGVARRHIARLEAGSSTSGTVDPGFGVTAGPNGTVDAIALQPDGRILIGGDFTTVDGIPRSRVARLTATGALDASFNPGRGANGVVGAIVLDGYRPLIVGDFTSVGGVKRARVARLNPNGSVDRMFVPNSVDALVYAVALQTVGKRPVPVIGGIFSRVGGANRRQIARLTTLGRLDTSFRGGLTPMYGHVLKIAPLADGRLLIAGVFTQVDGVIRNRIARLNANGALDTTFDPGIGSDAVIDDLVVQPDGRIVIGGDFTTFNGVPRTRLARLMPDGALDPSFDPGPGPSGSQFGHVYAIALQNDGRMVIGGYFTQVGGVTRNHLARINTDGTLDAGFNPDAGAFGVVRDLEIQPDGMILAAGDFTSIGGVPRKYIARIRP